MRSVLLLRQLKCASNLLTMVQTETSLFRQPWNNECNDSSSHPSPYMRSPSYSCWVPDAVLMIPPWVREQRRTARTVSPPFLQTQIHPRSAKWARHVMMTTPVHIPIYAMTTVYAGERATNARATMVAKSPPVWAMAHAKRRSKQTAAGSEINATTTDRRAGPEITVSSVAPD